MAAAEQGREETEERGEVVARLEAAEADKQRMEARLKDLADNDPAVVEQLVRETKEAVEATNRWTDNVFAIQEWVKKKFPSVDQVSRAAGMSTPTRPGSPCPSPLRPASPSSSASLRTWTTWSCREGWDQPKAVTYSRRDHHWSSPSTCGLGSCKAQAEQKLCRDFRVWGLCGDGEPWGEPGRPGLHLLQDGQLLLHAPGHFPGG